jgi:hypothetical protein
MFYHIPFLYLRTTNPGVFIVISYIIDLAI